MALNKYMHPRNPYKTPPDFRKLAVEFPEFRKHVTQDLSGKIHLNWSDEDAVRTLTKCLLQRDFNLIVEIPPNRLIPTLPSRLNYLLWLEDLLSFSGYPKEAVLGIDIGTGASCIYPLLAAKHFSWRMIATEVDEESFKVATSNVQVNNLSDLITVKQVPRGVMLKGVMEEGVDYAFCMCNPPFFSDVTQLGGGSKVRGGVGPRGGSASAGSTSELVAPGGEIGFTSAIAHDSVQLKDSFRVFSVMFGHKSSVKEFKKIVTDLGATSTRTMEFCQGRTVRWGVAWSFSKTPWLHQVGKLGGLPKVSNHRPISFTVGYSPSWSSVDALASKFVEFLTAVKVNVKKETGFSGTLNLIISASSNTWSHQRKAKRKKNALKAESGGKEGESCGFAKKRVLEGDSTTMCSKKVRIDSPTDVCSAKESKVEECSKKNKPEVKPLGSSEKEKNSQENKTEIDEMGKATQKEPEIDSNDTLKNETTSLQVDDSVCPKMMNNPKPEEEPTVSKPENSVLVKGTYLEASLVINDTLSDFCVDVFHLDGPGGREATNQIIQYLKNQLGKLSVV